MEICVCRVINEGIYRFNRAGQTLLTEDDDLKGIHSQEHILLAKCLTWWKKKAVCKMNTTNHVSTG